MSRSKVSAGGRVGCLLQSPYAASIDVGAIRNQRAPARVGGDSSGGHNPFPPVNAPSSGAPAGIASDLLVSRIIATATLPLQRGAGRAQFLG